MDQAVAHPAGKRSGDVVDVLANVAPPVSVYDGDSGVSEEAGRGHNLAPRRTTTATLQPVRAALRVWALRMERAGLGGALELRRHRFSKTIR